MHIYRELMVGGNEWYNYLKVAWELDIWTKVRYFVTVRYTDRGNFITK